MRLCRYGSESAPQIGFYSERGILPLETAANLRSQHTGEKAGRFVSVELLDYLPPDGLLFAEVRALYDWQKQHLERIPHTSFRDLLSTPLLVPIPRPNKIFLLAGNYAAHIQEGGGIAEERQNTFPYVFMKPPTTTLTHPGEAIRIPKVSPDAIDWELELAVVIGRKAKAVTEAEALSVVAGYTIINDISHRRYRPNPQRKPRDRDSFFDWLHGKWFDSFCPCGPCVRSADELPDPQNLQLTLTLNGQVKQDASTATMIFPAAAIVSFISQMVTLEPGDLISTGTPAGVGSTTGTFLKPGDEMQGTISRIGTLITPVMAEQ